MTIPRQTCSPTASQRSLGAGERFGQVCSSVTFPRLASTISFHGFDGQNSVVSHLKLIWVGSLNIIISDLTFKWRFLSASPGSRRALTKLN